MAIHRLFYQVMHIVRIASVLKVYISEGRQTLSAIFPIVSYCFRFDYICILGPHRFLVAKRC